MCQLLTDSVIHVLYKDIIEKKYKYLHVNMIIFICTNEDIIENELLACEQY